ncbi:hypothetical protein OE749_05310 [Aestuariibacter sp. AA17]|uniref:Uncharacterized protein n=1 Tax=Fluctibacter corallii TaxID=2984329 RepID=A0ABT3A5Z0_9ALTE|nr:hypothetical protein [Aestuariibacter sp. AA17]MCV2884103.1 hypothetical protein [Aestuariibacter sp. AA17]
MKKTFMTIALLASLGVVAEELAPADAELLAELKEYCQEVAEEERSEDQSVDAFVLECVNYELESMGYAQVAKIQ